MNLQAWLRQPTTINGLGALAGAFVGLAAHAILKDGGTAAAAGAVAFAATHLLINDNTVATEVSDVVQGAVSTKSGN